MMNDPTPPRMGCFVTGTDTGVGKTVIMAALAMYLRKCDVSLGVMKPIETGVDPDSPNTSDAGLLQSIADVKDPLSVICPYAFPDPLAPLAAARLRGTTISSGNIRQAYQRLCGRYPCMLVEGVGGVMVPIGENTLLVDMISTFHLPVVLVGRAALGGVNHLLLTLDRLQRHGVAVLAVVLNQIEEVPASSVLQQQLKSTVDLAAELSRVPVLGPLPPAKGPLDTVSTLEPLACGEVIRELGRLVMASASKKI